MKKPELQDFDLTEEEISLYEEQQKDYYKGLQEHSEYVKDVKKIIIAPSLVITFVSLIVAMANAFEVGGVFFGICIFWDITVVFSCWQTLDMSVWDIREGKKSEIKARTIDGALERAVERYKKAVWEYENYLKKCSIEFWNSLNGYEFEKEIAKLYRAQGYDATVTSATADGGVDVILKKERERIAVQCKHHAKPVGPNDVRALQGVVASQRYSKGIFVSLNGYTATVRYEMRKGSVPIELLELKDILQMAEGQERRPAEAEDETKTKPQPKEKTSTGDRLERQRVLELYKGLDDKNINMLLCELVSHEKFGEGIITAIKERKYISVYFPDIEQEKTFVFPDAFADEYIVPVGFEIVREDE